MKLFTQMFNYTQELQGPAGTEASTDKIEAMSELVREYKLTPVHQVSSGSIDGSAC